MSTWVPPSCTLPSAEQPRRIAEFDELFATALLAASRPEAQLLRLRLAPSAAGVVRDLIERESRCCTFFTFDLQVGAELRLDVRVPAAHVEVLDELVRRV